MNPGNDLCWMRRALELAERGRGHVEPNPLVGAVLVRDERVIGEGWHQHFGGSHAEVNALAAAVGPVKGATLYVTLEPCCHHGKTPPCTDAIMAAGVARVVAALPDPFPRVAGQGIERLRAAGIQVAVGVGAVPARRLNAPFLKLTSTRLPYVHGKWAMSLDGKIATRTGESKWLSGAASRARAHELRGRMDAIVIGIGTVLADNPLLTARPAGPRWATRVILDSQGRLPLQSQLALGAREVPVLLAVAAGVPGATLDLLRQTGVEILELPGTGRPDVGPLLTELGRRRMTNVLVEGGAEVLGSFLAARAIDEIHVFIAPRLLGGTEAKSPVGGQGIERLADALALADWQVERIESDLYVRGWRQS